MKADEARTNSFRVRERIDNREYYGIKAGIADATQRGVFEYKRNYFHGFESPNTIKKLKSDGYEVIHDTENNKLIVKW